jgi:signal transduction histidine kinase
MLDSWRASIYAGNYSRRDGTVVGAQPAILYGALFETLSEVQLEAAEHILEMDALRRTIGPLIVLVQRALAQAQAQAQRFAANAAHELRTPLTAPACLSM